MGEALRIAVEIPNHSAVPNISWEEEKIVERGRRRRHINYNAIGLRHVGGLNGQ